MRGHINLRSLNIVGADDEDNDDFISSTVKQYLLICGLEREREREREKEGEREGHVLGERKVLMVVSSHGVISIRDFRDVKLCSLMI
jgi:hypothetical protein